MSDRCRPHPSRIPQDRRPVHGGPGGRLLRAAARPLRPCRRGAARRAGHAARPTPSCASARRHDHRAAGALRDGPGHLDLAADADRRGTRRRLVEDPRRARAGGAAVCAHRVGHAGDRRLHRRRRPSSIATGRSAPRRARCWCRPRRNASAWRRPIAAPRTARSSRAASACATASSPKRPPRLPMPATVTLKDPKDWKVIGKPTRRLDTPEKVDGRAVFGLDVRFDGLLTARGRAQPGVRRQGEVVRRDRARAVPGVRKVVQVPSGVAVVADHFWAAQAGPRGAQGRVGPRRRRDARFAAPCSPSSAGSPARRAAARRAPAT